MWSFGVTWADIWGPLEVAGGLWGGLGRLGGALGWLKLQNSPNSWYQLWGSTGGPGGYMLAMGASQYCCLIFWMPKSDSRSSHSNFRLLFGYTFYHLD